MEEKGDPIAENGGGYVMEGGDGGTIRTYEDCNSKERHMYTSGGDDFACDECDIKCDERDIKCEQRDIKCEQREKLAKDDMLFQMRQHIENFAEKGEAHWIVKGLKSIAEGSGSIVFAEIIVLAGWTQVRESS